MSRAQRRSIGTALFAVAGLTIAVLGSLSLAIVPETQTGLVLRGGKVVRTVNDPAARPGRDGAGVVWRVPLVDRLIRYDARVQNLPATRLSLVGPAGTSASGEISARYRITQPRQLYRSAPTEGAARTRLEALLGDALRRSAGSGGAPDLAVARTIFAERARAIGVEIIDLSLDRLLVAEGAPRDAVLARMRDGQAQIAQAITAEGQAQANRIRAEGDARIAQLQRDSFERDPEFYEFYRALQSYETTFRSEGAGRTTWVLPPTEGYLRHFDPGRR